MDKKEQQVWDECLALWKEASETKTGVAIGKFTFKNRILSKLYPLKEITYGCPFCIAYDCEECPLNHCADSPYGSWADGVDSKGKHYKSKAKKFYNYLLKRYEERKAEDN